MSTQPFAVIEGWCIVCDGTLDGQPIDGPEVCPGCAAELDSEP